MYILYVVEPGVRRWASFFVLCTVVPLYIIWRREQAQHDAAGGRPDPRQETGDRMPEATERDPTRPQQSFSFRNNPPRGVSGSKVPVVRKDHKSKFNYSTTSSTTHLVVVLHHKLFSICYTIPSHSLEKSPFSVRWRLKSR